ncbi:MAG: DUF4133 domain-containing protein [Chitinophagaceae bacterium]|nr:DUF4133 domain-containing protein [Chitinophagaceae bacterium]
MPTIYTMHRRVNAPIEFKGLKGPYILLAGGTVVTVLFLFAILYILGFNSWICLLLCTGMGVLGIGGSYYCCRHYGIHGWRKRRVAGKTPAALRSNSRQIFTRLKK